MQGKQTSSISKPHRCKRGALQAPCCNPVVTTALTSDANLFCRMDASPPLLLLLSTGRLPLPDLDDNPLAQCTNSQDSPF